MRLANFLASGKLYYIDLSQEAMANVLAAGRENHCDKSHSCKGLNSLKLKVPFFDATTHTA
jgi:hypothetical protein